MGLISDYKSDNKSLKISSIHIYRVSRFQGKKLDSLHICYPHFKFS